MKCVVVYILTILRGGDTLFVLVHRLEAIPPSWFRGVTSDAEPMYMGNATTAKIEGRGKVKLKLTSEKELVLSDVLHVPEVTKNLISGPVLSNKGFKLVFESDKFVLTKGGSYVGKGYLSEGLFKVSVLPVYYGVEILNNDVTDVDVNAITDTSPSSVYMLESSSSLWHSRLGYVSFRSI